MKKVLFALLVTVSLASSAFADPANSKALPVKNIFSTAKSGESVKWVTTKNFVKATIVKDNVKTEVFYTLDGQFIGTSHAIDIKDLPISAKRSFAKAYTNFTVKEAIQFDGTEETAFYISAENEKRSVILKVINGNIEVFESSNKNQD